MPTVANYVVLEDDDIVLAQAQDVQFNFNAPDLIANASGSNRSMLLLKFNPNAADARIEIVLNNNQIHTFTSGDGQVRTLNYVLENGELLASGNTMIIGNRATGEFVISNLAVMYKTSI